MKAATLAPPHQQVRIDATRWPDVAARPRSGIRGSIARLIFRQAIQRLDVRVLLPDGSSLGRGDAASPVMVLHRPDDFFARVGADGLIGFGESYLAGDYDSPDLAAFLTVLCADIGTLVPLWMQRLRALYVMREPGSERNTTTQARGNIARHYDLSNEMFASFLDETMSYSSALFADLDVNEDLANAQRRKVDRILDRAGVTVGSRVLEIGTGWGELAIRAAQRGATVRTVTLSTEQVALARERISDAGCADLVDVELCDYRKVSGAYDAVVSVEMVEAVGHEYWPTYFAKLDELLAPGGRAVIQAITMPHERMLATRDTWTWINKYIFPGGFLPSTEAIERITRDHTDLRVVERFAMGRHYARTLATWDERFAEAHDRIAALGFDHTFERMWHFYLSYSRAGFASGYLDVQQILLTREGR